MKPTRLCASILLLLSLFGGCLEIETTTTVGTDGVMLRTVQFTADSGSITSQNLPMSFDSSWTLTTLKGERGKTVVRAERRFSSDEDLTRFAERKEGNLLRSRIRLEKGFRWFYTQYQYTETMLSFNPFTLVPIGDYLSPRELDLYLRHEIEKQPFGEPADSVALAGAGGRFEEWKAKSMFESYYREFLKGALRSPRPALDSARVASMKAELFKASRRHLEAGSLEEAEREFEHLLGRDPVREAVAANDSGFAAFRQAMRDQERILANSYRSAVIMPGVIAETNAPVIEGDRAVWSDYVSYCYVRELQMTAESRVMHWWAVVLTAVLLLGSTYLAIRRAARRRIPTPIA
ncbi:MAG: hypothetical protein AB1428_02735 [Bacteroidota bacterium]